MPLAASSQEVAAAFAALELPEAPEQRRDALAQFCARWLLPAGSDVLPAVVPQLASGPPPGWLPLVQDPEIRQWAAELYRIWGALLRQVRLGVRHAAAGAAAAAAGPAAARLAGAQSAGAACCNQLALVSPATLLQPPPVQAAPRAAVHPDRHSLLIPPGTEGCPFTMPSANRFREQYYWDCLPALQGLLVCELADLARVRASRAAGHGLRWVGGRCA